MPEPSAWYTRPVFVSSTFRERRHYLETVDLRWGVATADAADEEGKELLCSRSVLTR